MLTINLDLIETEKSQKLQYVFSTGEVNLLGIFMVFFLSSPYTFRMLSCQEMLCERASLASCYLLC